MVVFIVCLSSRMNKNVGIRLLGKEFVICFIETVFLPFLYQSKQYSEWMKEPMICEEMSVSDSYDN